MSVSKRHLRDSKLTSRIVDLYRNSTMTMAAISELTGTTIATVCAVLATHLADDERRVLKALKYSSSKRGNKNPMKGKKPPNFIGEVSDGRGYLTTVLRRKRYYVHRVVMAKMLGIQVERLPPALHVHHIDGDPLNNDPSNLALTTSVGHRAIHQRYLKTPEELWMKKRTLAEATEVLIEMGLVERAPKLPANTVRVRTRVTTRSL